MFYMRILPVAVFVANVTAHVHTRDTTLVSPSCAMNCTLSNLVLANCSLADSKNCLCTNTTLLFDLSICVQNTCDLTEQAMAARILQGQLCAGVAQPSQSAAIIRTTVIVTVFTHTVFLMRCISRYMVPRRIWWDDAFLIVAVISTVPMSIIPILNASKGFGKHFWDIPPENLRILRLLYYVSQILYAFVQPVTKISILLLYYRIFPDRHFRLALKISLVWMTAHFIAFLIEVGLQCLPVSSLWDLTIKGKCTNFINSVYAGAAFSIFEDIVIIVLPIFVLKDLNLSMRKKIALSCMFALGSFACVTSMIRLKYIAAFSHSPDVTWYDVDLILWSIVEVYTAIICASLVSIRPLVAKLFPSLFSTTKATTIAESKTQNGISAGWPVKMSSMLSGKLSSNRGSSQLLSTDDLPFDESNRVISGASAVDEGHDIELGETVSSFALENQPGPPRKD